MRRGHDIVEDAQGNVGGIPTGVVPLLRTAYNALRVMIINNLI